MNSVLIETVFTQ